MGSRRPAGEDGDERPQTKKRKQVLVHALYNAELIYEDREKDGEGSVMRQKQTKEREREREGDMDGKRQCGKDGRRLSF